MKLVGILSSYLAGYAIVLVATAAFSFRLGAKAIGRNTTSFGCPQARFDPSVDDRVQQLVSQLVELRSEHDAAIANLLQQTPSQTNCSCEEEKIGSIRGNRPEPSKLSGDAGTFAETISMPVEKIAPFFQTGVPLQKASLKQAIILRNTNENSQQNVDRSETLENCDAVNVVLYDDSSLSNSCTVLIPQANSLHVQRWMRVDENDMLDSTQKLQLVSQGADGKGHSFQPPTSSQTDKSLKELSRYLNSVDSVLEDLRPQLAKIAVDNVVTVMVCNFGQAELLVNFACSAKERGIDLSNVMVFVTDQKTADIAKSLGFFVYFDQRNFADLPTQASKQRGDHEFTAMMMAKVLCVQLVSQLGYDVLYQDVDIIWYRNPTEYLHGLDGDMIFHYDHNTEARFAPFAVNTGFYYVRSNDRTRHLLTSLVTHTDLVWATESHTAALTALMNDHVTRYGLAVRVLDKETDLFPSGYQWNEKPEYLRDVWSDKARPFLFHMSRTINKDYKIEYFQQMGEWWVREENDQTAKGPWTCRAKPQFVCHDPKYPCRWPSHR